jgi:hypothetical protein
LSLRATVAHGLWLTAGWPAARRFARALGDPATAQWTWLQAQLVRHAGSGFGQRHDFGSMTDASAFARRVPLATWEDLEPDVRRILAGESDVLVRGRVTHLAPTSGSTGARKLIPFTDGLQAGFNAAVAAWMHDLVRQRPSTVSGPAYWSISPLAGEEDSGSTSVPIGFADDADYLGGAHARLVRHALAVPSDIRHVSDIDAFRRLTLLALLRTRGLRVISIWHPSFLDLLLQAAEPAWPELLEAVATGQCPWSDALPSASRAAWAARPDAGRAAELGRIGAEDWPRWWPHLQVVSCWGEQAAEPGWRELVRRLPMILVQPKGLLATECVVTIPYGTGQPLAITSHYFEFLDEQGGVRGAHQLERGERYEVVVTNGGGLWRYRLGDVVECGGHVMKTPSLRFLGRAGRVSDLRGEKLSEAFVAEVLRDLWPADAHRPWVALRPDPGGTPGYTLLVAVDELPEPAQDLASRVDAALTANPHYALARRLGQLGSARVVAVGAGAGLGSLRGGSGRIGDAKPAVLLKADAVGPPA